MLNVVVNTEKFIKNKLTSKRNKGRFKFHSRNESNHRSSIA